MKRYILFICFFLNALILNGQNTKFIVWGDTQFQNPDIFESFVHKTSLINPELVLHVGDMIHGYTYNINNAAKQWERFKKQIAPIHVPFYPTPGNHDITTKEIVDAYAEAWEFNDKLYYSFSINNCAFIVLNAFEDQDFYKISDSQFNWLKKELETYKNRNIFISIHPPLHLENNNFEWKRIHNLLTQYNVRAVFTGHYHFYDFRQIDGIDYFCLNTSGNMSLNTGFLGGYSHHMLAVEVNGDSLNYLVHTLDSIYSYDDVNVNERENSKKYFEPSKTFRLKMNMGNIDTTISITINNNSNEMRVYKLNWIMPDTTWKIYPNHSVVNIPAQSNITPEYKVVVSDPNLSRNEMPYLNVESDYKTLKNKINISVQKISLFVPLVAYASLVNNEVIIDGILSEFDWQNKNKIYNLFTDANFTKETENTEVTVLYNNTYLFIGIQGAEPNPSGLSAAAYGEIPLVFADDDFELYFDTNLDLKTFYRLMVNPAGTILSSGPEGRYTFTFDVAVKTGSDKWSAEFKIPFEQIKTLKPMPGDVWGFNIRRHRQQAETVQSDWSKMNERPPYQPEYFGLLEFR
ncbi:MAG: metallophosphoesterase [Bacteroidetes bacterium]|nr:metallophosphoesterase [Bacteroidota bacterium]